IERGVGSDYKGNGKSVRMRDVQILFADMASGSNSPALVRQGRVAAMIAAKPHERRMILEEADGVSGLRARGHEAELKLRAAETNLTRADDVLLQLEAQSQSLKKQARQASGYRAINDLVRRAEAALLLLRWVKTEEQKDSVQSK